MWFFVVVINDFLICVLYDINCLIFGCCLIEIKVIVYIYR